MKYKINLNLLKIIYKKSLHLTKIWNRSLLIVKEMNERLFGVYNGHFFIPVFVTKNIIGRKLGEFSLTRKFIKHKVKIKDKKVKNKKNERKKV